MYSAAVRPRTPEKLSPFKFYQYLLTTVGDAEVVRFLRMLTFLPLEDIEAMEHSMQVRFLGGFFLVAWHSGFFLLGFFLVFLGFRLFSWFFFGFRRFGGFF
jgi:hypothetical protein